MQLYYDGKDCVIILDKGQKKSELELILEHKLEKVVNYSKNGEDKKVKISLEFKPNPNITDPSGILMSFLPEENNWTELLIQINGFAYNKLVQTGKCYANYNKKRSVYINNGDPEM